MREYLTQRNGVAVRDRLHAGKGSHSRGHAGEECLRSRGPASIDRAVHVDGHRHHALGPKPRIDGEQAGEAAHQQPRPDEQHHRQRDFSDHQRASETASTDAAGRESCGLPERHLEVHPRGDQGRADTRQNPGERGDTSREHEDTTVNPDWDERERALRERHWEEPADHPKAPAGREHTERATGKRQKHALDQRLPDQAPAGRAQSGPHRQLARSRRGACEHQVGHVGTRDQQHEPDRCGEQQQCGPHVAHEVLLEWAQDDLAGRRARSHATTARTVRTSRGAPRPNLQLDPIPPAGGRRGCLALERHRAGSRQRAHHALTTRRWSRWRADRCVERVGRLRRRQSPRLPRAREVLTLLARHRLLLGRPQDGGEVGSSLPDCYARLQPRSDVDNRHHLALTFGRLVQAKGQENVRARLLRKQESGRQHAHDREGPRVEPERPLGEDGVWSIETLPQAPADDSDWRAVQPLLVERECTAADRLDAEHGEEPRGDVRSQQPLGIAGSEECQTGRLVPGRHAFERCGVVAPFEVVRARGDLRGHRRRELRCPYEATGIPIRQGPKEQRVHDREDRGVRPDADGHRQESHQRERRVAAERAEGIAHVQRKIGHRAPRECPPARSVNDGPREASEGL